MNVIFHLVSLGVLLALLAQVAKQRQLLGFTRKFIAASAQPENAVWHVDWLHRFLNGLSYALNVEVPSAAECGSLAKRPLKSDLRLWSALHANCQIAELRCEVLSGQAIFTIAVWRNEAKAHEIGEQIRLNIPKDLSIKIIQATPAVASVKKGLS